LVLQFDYDAEMSGIKINVRFCPALGCSVMSAMNEWSSREVMRLREFDNPPI